MKHLNLIKKMTLEEKCSLLSGKNFWETMDIPHLGIPSMFMSDGPTGLRRQAAAADQLGLNPSLPATCIPTANSLASSWNTDLVEEIGGVLGVEAKTIGVGMLLAPGLNIKRNPKGGRCFEYFSEDPYLAGKMAAAYTRGVQKEGVAATIKHFACNSQETRRINSDSIVDLRALREIYLTNFEIAVKEGNPKAVMSSYNLVNGTYANENPYLMNEVLRKEWGFDGIVVSDWGGENDRVEGVKCNNDLEMPGNNGDTDATLVEAVKSGKLDENIVNENVDRIIDLVLNAKDVLKDYKVPSKGTGKDKLTGINCYPEMKKNHHEIASRAALETIVLLKNEKKALPLKKNEKVAFIGDFVEKSRYQGAGSSQVNPTKVDDFIDTLNKGEHMFEYVGFAKGYKRYGGRSEKLKKEALILANKADTVVYFMGLDELTESEGFDREDIEIPLNQRTLLEGFKQLGKKVIVVLSCGCVVDLSFDHYCDAILHGNLSGQAGCDAIYQMLIGAASPCGKLAETYPCKYEDIPSYKLFPSNKITSEYRESIYVGYRYYETVDQKVRYPFGFGLTYTTFAYSDLKISDSGVSFKITNTGKFPAKEVAQLYIGKKDSKIYRAALELKGFKKTNTLLAGDSVEVTIPFDEYTFRFFDIKTNKFEIEDGEYQIYVGSSCNDLFLKGTINKKGIDASNIYDEKKHRLYFEGKVNSLTKIDFENLLGREIPDGDLDFVNKKRTRINLSMTSCICDLKYARGWVGRLIGNALNLLIKIGKKFNNKKLVQVIIFGPYYMPMRALSRMAGMTMKQAESLVEVFDGHFFSGLNHFFKAGKLAPKISKENRYKEKENKK